MRLSGLVVFLLVAIVTSMGCLVTHSRGLVIWPWILAMSIVGLASFYISFLSDQEFKRFEKKIKEHESDSGGNNGNP